MLEKKITESSEHDGGNAHLKIVKPGFLAGGSEGRIIGESLASRLKAGNRQAAQELVEVYYGQIYQFMFRLGHSAGECEDLTQESFLRAWQHIGQIKDESALKSWMYRLAHNVSKAYWRKHKSRVESVTEAVRAASSRAEGENDSERREQVERLRKAIVKLPFKLRECVILHYMQGLTIAEAAEAADVRQGTFKSRLNRALRLLGGQMSDDGKG